ncbi:hypothetical protein P40081_11725 [Paenibacillus sp. FSL P4-0081]|nr:hypothetical protein P40081_11725 [Paenibacillus sp. FSL P4-0081]
MNLIIYGLGKAAEGNLELELYEGSIRLKAIHRKASIGSISWLRFSTANSGLDQETWGRTAAGGPNILWSHGNP